VLIGVLPVIKGTGYALLPVVVVAIAGLLLRRRDRRTLLTAGLVAVAFIATQAIWGEIAPHFGRATYTTPGGGSPVSGSSVLHAPGLFITYLWQVFLPKLPFMADHFQQAWPVYGIYIERGWAAFGWYTILFAQPVYWVITAISLLAIPLGLLAMRGHWSWVKRHWLEILVVVLVPVAVIAAVENAFTTPGMRPILAEMGRYAFTAIGALAMIAMGAMYGFGRRVAPVAMIALVVAAAVLTYASQLLTLRGFFT